MTDHGTDTNLPPHPEPRRPVNLVVSTPFIASLAEGQLEAYVAAIVAVAATPDRSEAELVTDLHERLDPSGIRLPVESYRVIARQVRGIPVTLTISTDEGEVLHGSSAIAAGEHIPQEQGTDDPENPDRPVYS